MKRKLRFSKLGLCIERCNSMANTQILHIDLSGNSYWAMPNTENNRKKLSKWLMEAAKEIRRWK